MAFNEDESSELGFINLGPLADVNDLGKLPFATPIRTERDSITRATFVR